MSTFTTKPSPQFKQEVFVYKSGSFWKIGRGCYEDGRFTCIGSTCLDFREQFFNGDFGSEYYTLKEQAIIDAKNYANFWSDKFVGVKGNENENEN